MTVDVIDLSVVCFDLCDQFSEPRFHARMISFQLCGTLLTLNLRVLVSDPTPRVLQSNALRPGYSIVRQLFAEKRQYNSGNSIGIIDERPVSAVRQNLYLSLGEDLALTLGEFNGNVGIVRAPDYQCGQVQGAQRFRELTRSLLRIAGISVKPEHGALCTAIKRFIDMVKIFRWQPSGVPMP
jgi:hypothetical protein